MPERMVKLTAAEGNLCSTCKGRSSVRSLSQSKWTKWNGRGGFI